MKKMKRTLAMLLTLVMAMSLAACGAKEEPAPAPEGGEAQVEETKSWAPSKNVEWTVTSSPGGGSDIYTRKLQDILTTEGLVDQTILVTNQTDGAGEVGRQQVSRKKDDGHSLLTFNNGDLQPMVQNTDNRIENFRPICVMAFDSRLLWFGKHTEYADFAEMLEAAKNGTHIVMGGSKGDDILTYEKLLEVTGMTDENISYITYDATSDAITALLGGHVDFVTSKPAAASQYMESGDMIPVLTVAMERYDGKFADVPTMSEVGDYEDFEIAVWRGIVAPASMPDEAVQFWSDTFGKVAESETWKTEYLDKYGLVNSFMPWQEATQFMADCQVEYLAAAGK